MNKKTNTLLVLKMFFLPFYGQPASAGSGGELVQISDLPVFRTPLEMETNSPSSFFKREVGGGEGMRRREEEDGDGTSGPLQ